MSKLTDFYTHKASLLEERKPLDPQWEMLEDQLLKEELLPELIEQLKSVLSKVKSPLMFSGCYDPNGCLSVSFTRNCIQVSTFSPSLPSVKDAQGVGSSDDVSEVTIAAEPDMIESEEVVPPEPRNTKAKSVGFSVSFRDGTVYHEKKAVNTWILALKKIGLENICNNRSRHEAWHRVNGQDICIVERTEIVRDSDGKSPQTLVDGSLKPQSSDLNAVFLETSSAVSSLVHLLPSRRGDRRCGHSLFLLSQSSINFKY